MVIVILLLLSFNQVSLVNAPTKLWELIEKAGGPTKAKELLLKRCQLHKNEHQQVFAIDDGILIAMLNAICCTVYIIISKWIQDIGYRQHFKYKYLWSIQHIMHIFNIH